MSEGKRPKSKKVEPFKRQFRVVLAEKEKADRRVKLLNVLDEIDELRLKFEAAKSLLKAELDAKQGSVDAIRLDIRAGELREVDCEREFNYGTLTVQDVRLDTGEVFNERKMSDSERQLHIDEMRALEGDEPK